MNEGYRLSPQQKRIWDLQTAAAPFLAHVIVDIRGDLNVAALKDALREVVSRHEALRTRFVRPSGAATALQVVESAGDAIWIDLGDAGGRGSERVLIERALAHAGSLDIERGFLHAAIGRVGPARHTLVLTLPAMCADTGSLRNLVTEIGHLYAGAAGELAPSDGVTQYTAYSEWQNSLDTDDYGMRAREFWATRNLDAVPGFALAIEEPDRDPQAAFDPASIGVVMPDDLLSRLEAACGGYGATPETFLLTAWHTLLHRLGGDSASIVGAMVAGRSFDELRSSMGPFARFVPIPCQFDGRRQFGDVLRHVEDQRFQSESWTDYFNWPAPDGATDGAAPPFFPFAFSFEELAPGFQAGGITITPRACRARLDRSRLHLRTAVYGNRLLADIDYDRSALSPSTMRMVGRFYTAMVKAFAAAPDRRIDSVPIVSGDERRQIVKAATSAVTPIPPISIADWFARVAATCEARTAIDCGGSTLTYRDLDTRANQLAHALGAHGVAPETRVALIVNRSTEAMVGLVGVIKAGAAYVPIDPTAPAARIEQQLQGSRAAVVLTEAAIADALPPFDGPVICLDRDWPAIASQPIAPPSVSIAPDHLLYIIHTSGSTGQPKAVGVTHRNLVNYVQAIAKPLGCSVESTPLRFASVSTLSADLGHTCIFPSLLSGGELHLVDYDTATDAARLAAYVTDRGIDVIKMVPSHLRALLACDGGDGVIPAQVLVLGGESLTPDLAADVAARRPSCRLIHHYGPTETTVGALTWNVGDAIARQTINIPIGRPLDNGGAYICDEHLQIVPPGVYGQLFIAGAGVSRGYLNDTRQTAERFVPDRFSIVPGGRLYATGDRARYLPDYSIEFLGRVDRQVKLRGHRVELAEVEATIRRHPAVRDAVVIVADRESPTEHLAAYVVVATNPPAIGDGAIPDAIDTPATAPADASAAIREFLGRELPEHMVPTAIRVLDAFPLTANGKIDYDRLRAAGGTDVRAEPSTGAPESPVASMVAEICAQNLGLERVGPLDNYFELGGHSLLAMRLVSNIRQVFGIELPLRAVFDAPTIMGLAEAVETAMREAAGVQAPEMLPAPRDRDIPVSFSQQRMWFLDQLDPTASYNILWSLRLAGPLDVDALRRALTEVVRRHEVLRTTFELRGDQPTQIINPPYEVDVPIVDVSGAENPEAEASRFSRDEARRRVDLRTGPLIRVSLVHIGPDDHVFVMTVHHIVSDRWSREIFTREFTAIYSAYAAGRPHDLPELPVQYADFSVWQRDWLSGDVLAEQMAYWKGQLEGVPALDIPTDRPRPPIQTFAGAVQMLTINKETTRALQQIGQRQGATLYMVVLAAFQTLLHRYSGQQDVVVGSPIACRSRSETQRLIGFFVNTIGIRANFADTPGFLEVLRRVRDAALGAFSHQDLPFEKLVEELNPQRDLSRAPIVQAMFDMATQLTPQGDSLDRVATGKLDQLNMSWLTPIEVAARFDLQLDALETAHGLVLHLAYNSDLFDRTTIRLMLLHLQMLVEAIVADPEQAVTHIPLQSAPTAKAVDLSATRPVQPFTPFEADVLTRSIADRFRATVAQFPDRLAIKTRRHTWTYRELDSHATATAAAIAETCGSDAPIVALLFEHDAPMVAGMLGALIAGACYVALDPSHPDDRLEDILADCQPAAVLTSRANIERATALAGDESVILTFEDLEPADAWSLPEVPADRMAYILYTSGTEGRPKGVVQSHGNVLHFISAYTNNLHISEQDRLTLFSSYGADAAVMDIFGAVLNGAALYPIDPRKESWQELTAWLREERITIFHSTPTLFSYVTEGLAPGTVPDIRLIVLGGEEALRRHFDAYAQLFSDDCLLVNGLGPTESTVTLQFFANKQTRIIRNSIPVGSAVDRTEILLAGEDLSAVGVRGEICIRSPHIALGYWRDPAATQAAFIADPQHPGRRIYRTGDLGRLLPDGSIGFLGRKDTQVKINGFRVELADVQSALNQQPDVLESVVLCRVKGGEKSLIAYFIPRERPAPDAAKLRQFMQARVPGYMVPAAFVAVDRFPRTANGKLDREAVLAIKETAEASGAIGPRDLIELGLARIWEELLDQSGIAINADFFRSGGSSLSAIRLLARIEQIFGVRIPLAQLFQGPTIESLASIVRHGTASHDSCAIAVQPRGTQTPIFCVHPVGGTVVCYADLARALGSDQPFYAFQHPGLCGGDAERSVEELAAIYIEELRCVQPEGPYRIGGLSMGGVVAFEMAQQLTASGHQVERLFLFDTYAPRPRVERVMDDADLLVVFLQDLGLSAEDLRQLDPTRRMQRVLEVAGARRLVTPDFTIDDAERLFAIAKSNLAATRRYQPRAYAGSLALFIVDETDPSRTPDRGWQGIVTGALNIRRVGGRHANMTLAPHATGLAAALRDSLQHHGDRDLAAAAAE